MKGVSQVELFGAREVGGGEGPLDCVPFRKEFCP